MEKFCASIPALKDVGQNECRMYYQEMGNFCLNMVEGISKPLMKEIISIRFWSNGLWRGIFNMLTRARFSTRSLAPFNLNGVKIRYGVEECQKLINTGFRSYNDHIQHNDITVYLERYMLQLFCLAIIIVAVVGIFWFVNRKPRGKIINKKNDPYDTDLQLLDGYLVDRMFLQTGHNKLRERANKPPKTKLSASAASLMEEIPVFQGTLLTDEVQFVINDFDIVPKNSQKAINQIEDFEPKSLNMSFAIDEKDSIEESVPTEKDDDSQTVYFSDSHSSISETALSSRAKLQRASSSLLDKSPPSNELSKKVSEKPSYVKKTMNGQQSTSIAQKPSTRKLSRSPSSLLDKSTQNKEVSNKVERKPYFVKKTMNNAHQSTSVAPNPSAAKFQRSSSLLDKSQQNKEVPKKLTKRLSFVRKNNEQSTQSAPKSGSVTVLRKN